MKLCKVLGTAVVGSFCQTYYSRTCGAVYGTHCSIRSYYKQRESYGENQHEENRYGGNRYRENQYREHQYAENQFGRNQYGRNQYGRNQFGRNRYGGTQFNNSFRNQNPHYELEAKPVDWNNIQLEPFKRNFYEPHPDVEARSKEEVEAYRRQHEIIIAGPNNIPNPITCFEESNFPDFVLQYAKEQKFSAPTVIQSQSWPIIMSGHNLVGIGKTGSGKTLGYVLPAIIHIQGQESLSGARDPTVLILGPTRELVQQIHSVAQELSFLANIKCGCIFGGANRVPQSILIKSGLNICIATPGRLMDFVTSGVINLQKCTYVVIDEADRMLDMGFEDQIRAIISQIRPDRQMLMWSATWPKEIKNLAKQYLGEYTQLTIGSTKLCANPNIMQNIEVCSESDKLPKLMELLKQIESTEQETGKILVFVQTKRKAEYIAFQMQQFGKRTLCIHGDKSQAARDFTITKFKSDKACILVATDVAARGLDVDNISHVINFDYPPTIETYIHRIGRTARVDKLGTSYTYITPEECWKSGNDLVKVLEESNQNVNPELLELTERNNNFERKNYRRNQLY